MEAGLDPEKAKKLYLDDLYELSLWMLSVPERRWLAAARMIYQSPEFYIENFYKKVEAGRRKDSDWVFLGGAPAYHLNGSCDKLLSDYRNFRIPVEIVHRGEAEKQKFREWFVENERFIDDPVIFVNKMSANFFLKNPPRIDEFRADNSGFTIEENPSLQKIQGQINKKIDAMKSKMDGHRKLISEYGMKTYLLRKGELVIQDASDREILLAWHDSKESLKKDLKTYFKVKFNPDLEFQDTLLQSIGFRPCKSCSK